MAQMSQVRRETASLSNTFDAIIKDATKDFEEMSDLIRSDLTNIIISYGLAIGLSFVALFFATSGIGRPPSNLWLWEFLIFIVSSILSTCRFFSDIWKDFQNLSNVIFNKTIEIDASFLSK